MPEAVSSYLKSLAEGFLFYLKPLINLNFSYLNPLFWGFLLLLFLRLLRIWQIKKSLKFLLSLSFILLATTKIELFFTTHPSSAGQPFDTGIIKLLSASAVVILSLLYFLVLK